MSNPATKEIRIRNLTLTEKEHVERVAKEQHLTISAFGFLAIGDRILVHENRTAKRIAKGKTKP